MATDTELTPDTRLRRRELSAALNEIGVPVAESSLATYATRGGGPPYQLFGRIPLYRWGDALAWVEGKLKAPQRTTSETDLKAA